MTKKFTLTLLPGDGIGPEAMAEVEKVIAWLESERGFQFDLYKDDIGGAAYDRYGEPLSDETLAKCQISDAVIMGSVGGPKWDDVDYNLRPEAGLLRCVRKWVYLPICALPLFLMHLLMRRHLKPEIVKGLDILIVRELTGGVYFGEPRGIEDLGNGQRRGVNTQVYETYEIERVGRVAFDLARRSAAIT